MIDHVDISQSDVGGGQRKFGRHWNQQRSKHLDELEIYNCGSWIGQRLKLARKWAECSYGVLRARLMFPNG